MKLSIQDLYKKKKEFPTIQDIHVINQFCLTYYFYDSISVILRKCHIGY